MSLANRWRGGAFFYNGCVQKCHTPNTLENESTSLAALAFFWCGERYFDPLPCFFLRILVVPWLFLGARRGRVFPGPRVIRAPGIAAVDFGFLVGPRREPQRAGVAECQRGHC